MLKFQVVAEKTAKNFRGLLFCCTLYISFTRCRDETIVTGMRSR